MLYILTCTLLLLSARRCSDGDNKIRIILREVMMNENLKTEALHVSE